MVCISDIVYCTNCTKVKLLLRLKEQSVRARVADGFENSEMEILIWVINCGKPQKVSDAELQELLDQDSAQTQQQLAEKLGIIQQAISERLRALGKN